jgi:hypothetical protein
MICSCLCALALAAACTPGGGASDANLAAPGAGAASQSAVPDAGAAQASPASAVDPVDPWSALGPLTGQHRISISRLSDDCSFGPDVSFDPYRGSGVEPPADREEPLIQTYDTQVTQKGDALVFELGEGLVLARWSEAEQRLVEVVRVGAEGVTQYLDGFAAAAVSEADDLRILSGESDWSFEDRYWEPGEVCQGRTLWQMEQRSQRPSSATTDVHFVLRWPAESRADLDLMLRPPEGAFDDISDENAFAHFGEVNDGCYVLHAVGVAVAEDDPAEAVGGPAHGFVTPFEETALADHEEILRCGSASYGTFEVWVVNWSREAADFELAIFDGPGVGTGAASGRSFGVTEGRAAPLSATWYAFEWMPPPSQGAGYSVDVWTSDLREPAARGLDSLTGTLLGFDKAAYEGVDFDAFLDALGLVPLD